MNLWLVEEVAHFLKIRILITYLSMESYIFFVPYEKLMFYIHKSNIYLDI